MYATGNLSLVRALAPRHLLGLACLLNGIGCVSADAEGRDDEFVTTSSGASSTADAASSSGFSTSSTGQAGEESSAAESASSGGGSNLPLARGIGLGTITIDQGVRRVLVLDGKSVERADAEPRVLQSRPAVVRAFYELDEDFERRTIYAVLRLREPDGSLTMYDQVLDVFPRDCTSETKLECDYPAFRYGFSWPLPADAIVPGTDFRVDLYEARPGFEDLPITRVPSFPEEGFASLRVEDTYMKLRVKVVTVEDDPPCRVAPDLNAEVRAPDGRMMPLARVLEERLAAMNPVDEVEIVPGPRLRLPPSVNLEQTGGRLLDLLQEQRMADGAPPGWYYYALVSGCFSQPQLLGLANVAGPTKDTALYRVSWGLYLEDNIEATTDTFVHEVGHNQGLGHVACSGTENGVDPSYVDHPQGDVTSWGIDVFSTPATIREPSAHDYMTYCPDKWVSAWTWNRVEPSIETISSWELERAEEHMSTVLVGTVWPNGDASWSVGPGEVPKAWVSPDQRVEFRTRSGRVRSVPAAVRVWRGTSAQNIIAPVPDDVDVRTLVARWIEGASDRIVPISSPRIISRRE